MTARTFDSIYRAPFRPAQIDLSGQSDIFTARRRRATIPIEDVLPRTTDPAAPVIASVLQDARLRPRSVNPVLMYSAVGLLSFIALYFLEFGEIVVAIYAMAALVRKMPSRTAFIASLISLVGVVLAEFVTGSDSNISDNLAVYAFLFLTVGTILAFAELHRSDSKMLLNAN